MTVSVSRGELLHEDQAARIWWDDKAQILELEALQWVSSEYVRGTMERTLELMKQKKARKFLAGMSEMDKVEGDLLLWAESDWFH